MLIEFWNVRLTHKTWIIIVRPETIELSFFFLEQGAMCSNFLCHLRSAVRSGDQLRVVRQLCGHPQLFLPLLLRLTPDWLRFGLLIHLNSAHCRTKSTQFCSFVEQQTHDIIHRPSPPSPGHKPDHSHKASESSRAGPRLGPNRICAKLWKMWRKTKMHNYDFHVPITRISAASWYLEKLIFPISPLDSQSDRSAHCARSN